MTVKVNRLVLSGLCKIACLLGLALCESQVAMASPVFEITPSSSTVSLSAGSSSVVSFTVTNRTGLTLTVDQTKVVGNEIAAASISSSTCSSLADNDSCMVNVSIVANSAGSGPIDLHVCAYEGALCSGSNPKVDVTVSGSARAFIANGYMNTTFSGTSSVSRCDVNVSTGQFSDCEAIYNDNFVVPIDVAFHPSGRYLYVINGNLVGYGSSGSSISYCQIDAHSGALDNCQTTGPSLYSYAPAAITFNAAGTEAYIIDAPPYSPPLLRSGYEPVISYSIIHCSVNAITKALDTCTSAIESETDVYYGLTLNATGDRALVTYGPSISLKMGDSSYGVLVCQVDASTGTLSCSAGLASESPLNAIVFGNNNRVFMTMSDNNKVKTCVFNYDGASLDSCQDTGVDAFTVPMGIALSHDASQAFVTNRDSNMVSRCDVATDGVFSNCVNSGATSIDHPDGIAIH